jgi:hypothetical protein
VPEEITDKHSVGGASDQAAGGVAEAVQTDQSKPGSRAPAFVPPT